MNSKEVTISDCIWSVICPGLCYVCLQSFTPHSHLLRWQWSLQSMVNRQEFSQFQTYLDVIGARLSPDTSLYLFGTRGRILPVGLELLTIALLSPQRPANVFKSEKKVFMLVTLLLFIYLMIYKTQMCSYAKQLCVRKKIQYRKKIILKMLDPDQFRQYRGQRVLAFLCPLQRGLEYNVTPLPSCLTVQTFFLNP